jgi:hypothetical protein
MSEHTAIDPSNMAALAQRRAAANEALAEQQALAAEAERLAQARATTKIAKAIAAEAAAADQAMREAVAATVVRQRTRHADLIDAQANVLEAVHAAAVACERAQAIRGAMHGERRRLLAPLQQAVADADHGSPEHRAAREMMAATEAALPHIPRPILRGSEPGHLEIRAAVATVSSLDLPVGRGAAIVNQNRRNQEHLAALDLPEGATTEGGPERDAANATRLAELGVS